MNREIGAEGWKGGTATAANRVQAALAIAGDLPPLETPADARYRLDLVFRLGLAGTLAGSVAGAMVRSCEVWVRAFEVEVSAKRVRELDDRVLELEKELKRYRGA